MKRYCISMGAAMMALWGLAGVAHAQTVPAKEVVAPEAYASYDPVGRGMTFQVAVVLKIKPGFHVNAREVTADYLIPTEVRTEAPAGFKLGETIYPKGTLQSFAFSKNTKLNVYTDTVTVLVPLTALGNAPLGTQHIPIKVKYQACSQEICLPPVTKEAEATINVAAAPGAAKPANAQVFAK